MCNLNLLFRTELKKDLKPFFQSITSNSFSSNNSGEGFYLDFKNTTFKSKNKINYQSIRELNKSKMILTHQRLSTSGYEVKYNHPFINEDFVLLHNGVMNHFKKNIGSDTFGFFIEFNKEFKTTIKTEPNRERAIIKVIEDLFKKDLGSYSIFILDKKSNIGYYFKDSSTKINFYRNKDYLYITTNSQNHNFFSLLSDKKFYEYEIKPRIIYKINPKNLKFNVLKELKMVYSTYTYYKPESIRASEPESNNNTTLNLNQSQSITEPEHIKPILTKNEIIKEYFCYNNEGFSDLSFCDNCRKELTEVYFNHNNFLFYNCLEYELSQNHSITESNNTTEPEPESIRASEPEPEPESIRATTEPESIRASEPEPLKINYIN
jgi:predicted glutamine amidotransferase